MKTAILSILILFSVASQAKSDANSIVKELMFLQGLSEQCLDFVKELKKTDYKHGWVKSEESPLLEDSKTLDIFYYYKQDDPDLPMTVIYNGGPAKSSHSAYQNTFKEIEGNFLFIDQRGTGCSTPFLKSHQMPKLGSWRHSYWGTEGIVRDSEIVRETLGIEKWNIFGQSYGAYIVQRYLEQSPEAILRAISHGGGAVEQFQNLQIRYEEQQKVVHAFFQKYPMAADMVESIKKDNRCYGQYGCGDQLLGYVRSHLGFLSYWPYLHTMLKFASPYVPDNPNDWVIGHKDPDLEAEIDDSGYVTHYLYFEFSGEFISSPNCYKIHRLSLRQYQRDAYFLLSECYSMSEGIFYLQQSKNAVKDAMKSLNVQPIQLKKIRENLEKYEDVECYIFSGQYDYYSPPLLVRKSARTIGPRCQYQELKWRGHNPYIPEVMELFVDQPQTADL